MHLNINHDATRRQLLRTAAVGGGAIAAASVLPSIAQAATGSSASTAGSASAVGALGARRYVPGVDVLPDLSHSTEALAGHIRGYFEAKSTKNLDWQSSYFDAKQFTYIDAVLGWHWYSKADLEAALQIWYPSWPAGSKSYPTRLLGDTTSAILIFTDTPGMFGLGQVRDYGAVDFNPDGTIGRWVDYWDARQFGVAGWHSEVEPPDNWPTDFRESTVGEHAAPLMRTVAHNLASAFRNRDINAAMELFSTDAVYEEVAAHIQITSQASIKAYLTKAASLLPYIGSTTGVRHVLGDEVGGGYEWTNTGGPIPRGITALELDPWGRIERFSAVWNGALATGALLAGFAQDAIEY
ncbi:twin-arginine translocation signal domain-containing protein [Catenulispora rubra]|uniref:twin-arginine translocation signal domain-containing protein n=1 Tax=Catenulispora rubra TaxID=280293 RepID=UPI001892548E|nr:nuclear transport factor 2 family protein [Catenulispora rubra]